MEERRRAYSDNMDLAILYKIVPHNYMGHMGDLHQTVTTSVLAEWYWVSLSQIGSDQDSGNSIEASATDAPVEYCSLVRHCGCFYGPVLTH